MSLPAGTVSFLLTDIEGSTQKWQLAPDEMAVAVARHYEILDLAISAHGGVRPEEQGEGDSIVAAFSRASDALSAALDAQRALQREPWPASTPIAVRMASTPARPGCVTRRTTSEWPSSVLQGFAAWRSGVRCWCRRRRATWPSTSSATRSP